MPRLLDQFASNNQPNISYPNIQIIETSKLASHTSLYKTMNLETSQDVAGITHLGLKVFE